MLNFSEKRKNTPHGMPFLTYKVEDKMKKMKNCYLQY